MENRKNEEIVELYKLQKRLGNDWLAEKLFAELLDNNRDMVKMLLNKVCNENLTLRYEDREDLYQECMMALMIAANTYDEKKAAFGTYAYHKMSFAIKDWLRHNHVISIPNQKQTDCRNCVQILDRYKAEHHGKEPSDEYIASAIGKKTVDIRDIKRALEAYNLNSLDSIIVFDGKQCKLADTIIDEKNPYLIVDLHIMLEKGLKLLQRREQEIIEMFYFKGLSLDDIAQKLNLTQQNVWKIKKCALNHLAGMDDLKELFEE